MKKRSGDSSRLGDVSEMLMQKPPLGTPLDWENPLNDGVMMHLAMNEGHGDKGQDLSLNGNHGTLNGMAFPPTTASGWNPGLTGIGLNFDGTDDYIDCGKVVDFQEVQVSLLYQTSDTRIKNGLFDFDPASTRGNFVLNLSGDGRPILYLGDANYKYFADISEYTDGEWHSLVLYIAGSADADITSATLTIDGIDIPTDAFNNGGAGVAWTGCNFGKTLYGNFAGSIDQPRIMNKRWSAKEARDYTINPWQVYLQ